MEEVGRCDLCKAFGIIAGREKIKDDVTDLFSDWQLCQNCLSHNSLDAKLAIKKGNIIR